MRTIISILGRLVSVVVPGAVLAYAAVKFLISSIQGLFQRVLTLDIQGQLPGESGVIVGGLSSVIGLVNAVFPLDFIMLCATAYLALASGVVIFRWVKSLIPTMSN